MSAVPASRQALYTALAALALAWALAGCASSVSTSSFKGEQHDVAQAVADLQSDVTAGDEEKICKDDLAASLGGRLNTVEKEQKAREKKQRARTVRVAAPGRCRRVVKDQLTEIDSTDMKVESVALAAGAAPRRATARVRSVYEGKRRFKTLSLVKEGGRWRIAGLG